MEAIRTYYLDEDGQPTETEHGDVRVRLYYDEADGTMADASGDAAPLIVYIDPHFGHVYQKVEAGEQYSGGIDGYDVARAWERFRDTDKVARWLRICYGVRGVDVWDDPRSAARWFAIATDAHVKATMGDDVTDEQVAEALKHDVEFIRDWAEGDIYRWEVERRRTGRKVYDDGDETEFDEWDSEDSCGGFIGRDYAETEALSALGYEPGLEDNAGR